MKKILYIWKGAYPWDIRVSKICNSLSKNGYKTTILCRWNNEEQERTEINDIKIIRVGYKLKSSLSLPVPNNPLWRKSIKFTVEEIKPDLIIVREIMLANDVAMIAKEFSIPIVMDMAENYPAAMKDWKKYKKTILSKLLVHKLDIPEKLEKKSVNKMDGIITVCQEQNDRLNNTYNYNYNNMCVVHNTPYLSQFPSKKDNFNSEHIVFGHHGYTTDEKSLYKFVQGFIKAYETEKNIYLKIAGNGESIDTLKEIAINSAAKSNIFFTGSYFHNDLMNILLEYDVGILPYQISDFNNYTLHNKIFDFFAYGIPVFLSQTKPFLRIIDETGAGISVDCENINNIAEEIINFKYKYNLSELGEKGRQAFLKKYNWENDYSSLNKFLRKYF